MELAEIVENFFGWKPPACWECGEQMTVTHITQLENTLSSTDGKVEFQCFNVKNPHGSYLTPFVVFERVMGVDKVIEYGWAD